MTQDIRTRHEQDRHGYLAAQRAAEAARSHARYYEACAEQVKQQPELGRWAEEAATILRRAYCAASLGLLELADRADDEAADYRAHLTGESA